MAKDLVEQVDGLAGRSDDRTARDFAGRAGRGQPILEPGGA